MLLHVSQNNFSFTDFYILLFFVTYVLGSKAIEKLSIYVRRSFFPKILKFRLQLIHEKIK